MDNLMLVAIGITAVIAFVLGAAVMYFACRHDEQEFEALEEELEELRFHYINRYPSQH